MRRAIFPLALMALLTACGEQGAPLAPEAMALETAPSGDEAEPSVALISAQDLAAKIEQGEVVLIDVRTPAEFAEGRLPGSLNAPVETFDAVSIPIEAERETILYCRSAGRSERAAQMLAEHTGGTVRHMEGGIIAWQDEGFEVVGASPAE